MESPFPVFQASLKRRLIFVLNSLSPHLSRHKQLSSSLSRRRRAAKVEPNEIKILKSPDFQTRRCSVKPMNLGEELPSNGGRSAAMTVSRCSKPCNRRKITSMEASHQPLALKLCMLFHVFSKSGSVSDAGDESGGSDMKGESNAIRSTRDAWDTRSLVCFDHRYRSDRGRYQIFDGSFLARLMLSLPLSPSVNPPLVNTF